MALETYNAKRDFTKTPEPAGQAAPATGNAFVIQKHDATRLHYDLRLEWQGVMKSWAVTRGPSLNPRDKRLAVEVEDHPLDYNSFEGTIPKGEYGGGTVIVWDRGTWSPAFDAAKGFAKGHLEFDLTGEKLHGRWHLVRIKGKPSQKRTNWLLIKGDDQHAAPDRDILADRAESVQTARSIEDVAAGKPAPRRKAAKPNNAKANNAKAKTAKPAPAPPAPADLTDAPQAKLPDFIPPALATLQTTPPTGPKWTHEIKFDGYRLQTRIDNGRVQLLTRSGHDWTARFGPAITTALAALPVKTALLDGEVVVESAIGASDFSALQADLSAERSDRFILYLFDLMHLDGHDIGKLPQYRRFDLLKATVPEGDPIRLSHPFNDAGSIVLGHACRLSLEGIVSKRCDEPYRSGRGRAWIKSKCAARQEFVIGGFTPSTTDPRAIGALLLGVFDGKDFRNVGRVGTGFTRAVARDLYGKLDAIRQAATPFTANPPPRDKAARFTKPELVAEVEFRAWTGAGQLRHASFRGLREDKPASEVTRETPKGAGQDPPARRRIRLTHPDRVYWPDAGVTKEGLADYYADVWPQIAPFIAGRPLALVRCPTGIDGQHFFQKHLWRGAGKHIARIPDPSDPKAEPFIGIDDLDGLMELVQAGVLEIHPWGAATADLYHPDQLTLDLDPGDGVDWPALVAAASEVRDRLQAKGLTAFVKTSGGKGLHVVAPLRPKADWTAAKAFTKAIAHSMATANPDRYVATITKAKRKGRILIDYLRNQWNATAVAAYSTRARPGAAVSVPLDWDELATISAADAFTTTTLPPRLATLSSDPWQDFRRHAVPLVP